MSGESVALVGWIPGASGLDQLQKGSLKEAWPADSSIRLLLSAGNQRPPQALELGELGLQRHLDTRDFRGAIAIAGPTLYIGNGRPVFLHWRALSRQGYTPFRLGPFQYSSDGIADRCGDVFVQGNQVVLRTFLRMKLGFLGQLAGKALTWHWPPWATLMIEYSFDVRNLGVTVSFCGTGIPSQRRYVDWRMHSDYEIETELSIEGYRAFVETGECLDAMAYRYETVCPVKNSPLPVELTIEEIRSMRILREGV